MHHAGELLPGEEQEDIVMTSTHGNVLNTICPVSGKSIFDLAEPVRRYSISPNHSHLFFALRLALDYERASLSYTPLMQGVIDKTLG